MLGPPPSPPPPTPGAAGGVAQSVLAVPPPAYSFAWAPPAPASASVGKLPPSSAAHPTPIASRLGGARFLPGVLTLSHTGGGGGEGSSPLAHCQSHSVRGAAARPRWLCPLPYHHHPTPACGQVPPPRCPPPPPPPRRRIMAIASPPGALVGCGPIDTLLPGRWSGP